MVMDIIIMATIILIKNSQKHNKIRGSVHVILHRSGPHILMRGGGC